MADKAIFIMYKVYCDFIHFILITIVDLSLRMRIIHRVLLIVQFYIHFIQEQLQPKCWNDFRQIKID